MNVATMTLHGSDGGELTIPVTPAPLTERESGPDRYVADCVLGGTVAYGVPVWVEILLRTDGTWDHWVTRFNNNDNHYLHIQQEQRGPITEAQRRTIARWWLDIEPKPYDMPLGSTICQWAFEGMTPDEVSRRYGEGKRVYLNAE